MDDSKIIELYNARSEDAIAETSKKYGRYCYSIAYNILHSNEDSEECVNDTYLRAWNVIPPQKPDPLSVFLGRITRNLSLDRWRRKTSEKRGGGEIPLALDELAECIPSLDDHEQALEKLALTEIIDRFLGSLPTEKRKIFVRRYWHLSPVKEIAADFGFSVSKVKMILMRTREELRKYLAKEGVNI